MPCLLPRRPQTTAGGAVQQAEGLLVLERISGIFVNNLPLWSRRTMGMTKIPKIPGLFRYFFGKNLRRDLRK